MTTLKTILDTVCDDALIERDANYATNSDPQYQRLVRYANKTSRDILSVHNWSALKKRGTVTVVSGTTLYDLPSDYSHLINDTAQTGSGLRKANVPMNDSIISLSDVRNITTYMGRLLGNQIELVNMPSGTFYFMYMSKGSVQRDGTGDLTDTFLTDNDQWLLDDELLIRGILWRWHKAEGHPDAASEMNDFTNYFKVAKARDIGARVITSGGQLNYISPPDIDGYTYE